MKPFSYNGDAREWNEESVENLRHESSTLRSVWGDLAETDGTGGKPLGL